MALFCFLAIQDDFDPLPFECRISQKPRSDGKNEYRLAGGHRLESTRRADRVAAARFNAAAASIALPATSPIPRRLRRQLSPLDYRLISNPLRFSRERNEFA